MLDFKATLNLLAQGQSLSFEQSRLAFEHIMTGEAMPSQIGAFLMALRVRGETIEEIAGAVATMRSKMVRVEAPLHAVDVVGTGGDGSGSYNISTLAAFIVAGAGVPVAKHGNRALSSKSGAADCLMALGVKIDLSPEHISQCIKEMGIGFMFAPNHHPAMKFVGPTRVELGTRTIFNLLGPLSNPASVTKQMIGVFAPQWLVPVAETLKKLGSQSAMVVHGEGLDEITGTGVTKVAELSAGKISTYDISPQDFGLQLCSAQALKGGDAQENASALRAVLEGENSPYGQVALMNAAATLKVAGKAKTLQEGFALATHSLNSKAALNTLENLILISNSH